VLQLTMVGGVIDLHGSHLGGSSGDRKAPAR
jgi:hypothetical protein